MNLRRDVFIIAPEDQKEKVLSMVRIIIHNGHHVSTLSSLVDLPYRKPHVEERGGDILNITLSNMVVILPPLSEWGLISLGIALGSGFKKICVIGDIDSTYKILGNIECYARWYEIRDRYLSPSNKVKARWKANKRMRQKARKVKLLQVSRERRVKMIEERERLLSEEAEQKEW